MKIRRLLLKAYGPFTEVDLDLQAPVGSINVIYGQNEAGKSSALRALEGFCFGIEDRTADNHLHSYDQMRIGANLEMANGTQGVFLRRKGKKNTLSDATGAAVTDEAFEKFLCGVSRPGFEALFCLSYQRLSEASKDILVENGELGKLLFEARSDLSLRNIQSALSKRAEALYRGTPRSSAIIDKSLSEYDSLRKALRKGDLAEYKDVQSKLSDLEGRKKKLGAERDEYRKVSLKLHKYLSAIPRVHRLRKAQESLALLGQIPDLPPDFAQGFSIAKDSLLAAKSSSEQAKVQVESIESRLSDISVNTALLDWSTQIDALIRKVEQITKHEADMPKEEKKATESLSEARSSLSRVRPGEEPIEANLSIEFSRNRIATLGRDKSSLDQKLIGAQTEVANTVRRLSDARSRLADTSRVQVSSSLASALKAGRSLGEAENQLKSLIKEAGDLQRTCGLTAARLGAAERNLAEFVRTEAPSKAVIQGADDELRATDSEIQSLKEALATAHKAAESSETERRALLLAGDVPTEGSLAEARDSRDQRWQEIRAKVSVPLQEPLPSPVLLQFETSVSDADALADRLRREAERTSRLASIEAQIQVARARVASINDSIATAVQKRTEAEDRWKRRWSVAGIKADTPRQMADWLVLFDQLGKDSLRLEGIRTSITELELAIASAKTSLLAGLGTEDPSATLADLIMEAERLTRASQQSQGTIQTLEAQIKADEAHLKEAEDQIEEIKTRLDEWSVAWKDQTATLKLDRIPTPEEADIAIKAIDDSLRHLGVARIAEKRVNGMKTDIREFAEAAQLAIDAIAPELRGMPALVAVQNLYRSLKEAEQLETRKKTLQENLTTQKTSLDNARRAFDLAEDKLKELCERAGCDGMDTLAIVVEQHSELIQLQATILDESRELESLVPGRNLDEFYSEVVPLDLDTVKTQLDDIDIEVERLNKALDQVNQEIGQEMSRLSALDNGIVQVETQRKAEDALTRVRSAVRPYLIYSAAESLIRAQIEEFRRANQGPILKKAGEIFSVLTDGSFTELTAELDDKDQPVLIAVRTSRLSGAEERLKVEALSSATRIGLYLALRLACLYHHIDQREGLPFVADDILLDFDDARARRVMEELGRLAEKTQVILFTHHKHLVDIGREVLGERCLVQNLTR